MTLWLCPRMTLTFSHCFQYMRHENRGERHYCRSLNEKGKEGVGFVKWYHQEPCTHLISGNNVQVVEMWGLFMDVLLAPHPKCTSLENISSANIFKGSRPELFSDLLVNLWSELSWSTNHRKNLEWDHFVSELYAEPWIWVQKLDTQVTEPQKAVQWCVI